MKELLLTIAIPTYDRPRQLAETLRIILPQLVDEPRVKVLILDNCSQIPVDEVLASVNTKQSEQIKVIRHSENIGGIANVMRSFELCDTEWLWVLSDDDCPRKDAIKTILGDMEGEHLFSFYQFPQSRVPSNFGARTIGKTLHGLFEAIKYTLTPLTLLSAGVYRIGRFRDRIKKGYASATTGIPHLAMIFSKLEESAGAWLLSERTICEYNPPARCESWMVHVVFLGLPSGYTIFKTASAASDYRKCLLKLYRNVPEFLLINFIAGFNLIDRLFSIQSRVLFKMAEAAYGPSMFRHPCSWLKWKVVGLIAFFPATFVYIVLQACRIMGREPPRIGSSSRTD